MTRRTTLSCFIATAGIAALLSGCAPATPTPAAALPTASPTVSPTASPSVSPTASRSSGPSIGCTGSPITAATVVEVTTRFADGRAEPAPRRHDVAAGATVVIRAQVDTPAEIHLHGYDRMAEATPSAPACLEFVADVPGVFELEAHPKVLLAQLAVR